MTEKQTRLTINAQHPAVKIEVLDAACRVAAKGYGRIDQVLPTGLYTVRYRAGDAMEESDVILRPDRPIRLDKAPDLCITSAAPLAITSTSHEYHQAAAWRLSRAHPHRCGEGAELLVFVRDVVPGGQGRPAAGLTLHKSDGERLLTLDDVSESEAAPGQALWAGRNIAVDPGSYRLRLALAEGEPVEMSLIACPDWQTQVFLLRQYGPDEMKAPWAVDLSWGCILMARIGWGFDPAKAQSIVPADGAGEDLRLTELACQSLAYGRRGIGRQDLAAMLQGKWDDPLLGILGVHLLLQQPQPDLDLAGEVIDRLRTIVGVLRHPDVDALALGVAQRRGKTLEMAPIQTPPMLRRSWQMLVQATADQPHLIPPDSLPGGIADRLWGSGAWLAWEVPPEPPADVAGDVALGAADWIARFASALDKSSLRKGTGLEDLADRIIVDGITLFKRGFGPHVTRESLEVAGESDETSDEGGREKRRGETAAQDSSRPLEDDSVLLQQIGRMAFEQAMAAVQSLLASWPNLAQLDLDELASKAGLDQIGLSLLVQLAPQRGRGKTSPAGAPLTLGMLVNRLGLPSMRVQRAMRELLVKLVQS